MTKFDFKCNKYKKFPRGGDSMHDEEVEPTRADLEGTPVVSLNEATGYPAPVWGKGEEPYPKPYHEEEGGEDYPVTVSP